MNKFWFLETRPQFLILDFVLVILGTSVAAFDGYFNIWYALLGLLGLLFTHSSVNTLNDYFDYKSGIDLSTRPTPFSGGSGLIPSGKMKPQQVLLLGIVTLVLAIPIGIYFILIKGWLLLPLLVVAALCILIYSPVILKTPFPEWAAGLGLGFLPVLGCYFIQTGFYSWHSAIAAFPAFILVYNLLFLNEFPDVEADRTGGRKTTPILVGKDKASLWYTVLTFLLYVWIVAWVFARVMPAFALISLLTLPLAIKAINGATNHKDMNKLMPGMMNNVLVVIITQLLLGIGYILSIVFG